MTEKKKKWIKKATENAHGQFREKAERAGKSTKEFANEHASDTGKIGKQARLAKALIGTHKEKAKVAAPSPKSMRHKMYGSKD